MKYIFWCLLVFNLSTMPAIADETINEETAESTTETLENSTTEALVNEEKSVVENQQPSQTEEPQKRPRGKWDFSDRPEDKKNKTSQDNKKQNTNKRKKFNSPKKLEDPETTWTSPTSGKVRQSTYAN